MEFTILDPGPDRRLAIGDEITIADAAELRDALALALTTSSTLELDLSGVESCDIAGLQILTALVREPHPVRITAASRSFIETLDLLQLTPLREACATKEPA